MLQHAARRAAIAPARAMSTAARTPASIVYNLVFKRNLTYITYVVVGAITLEVVYGAVTDGFWGSVNKGVRGCRSSEKTHDSVCAQRRRWQRLARATAAAAHAAVALARGACCCARSPRRPARAPATATHGASRLPAPQCAHRRPYACPRRAASRPCVQRTFDSVDWTKWKTDDE